MMLFPIVERELRVAVRKPITYWSRVAAALAAAALVVWMLVTLGTLVSPDLLGARMFKTLATVAFFCCLLPGVVLTADCISEERREGTLGLLFLTDLKGYDVVLGKLLATSLRAFYGLIAVLPLLAVSFFVGGVTFGEFWRVLAALLNTLWLSLAAGMFLSSISWRDQRSMLGTAFVILGITYILPACVAPLAVFSPQTMFSSAFEAEFVKAWLPFTASTLLVHLSGWLFLGIAAWVVGKRLAIEPAKRDAHGQPARAPSPLMESHPAEWLACRSTRHGWLWMSLAVPVAVWGAGVAAGQKWWNPLALLAVVFALHLLVQFWLAWESTRRFNEIRRNGNLELLMSTPVSDRDIVQGHAIGLERQFAGPIFTVLTMDAVLIILSRTHFKWPEGEAFEFFTMTAAMIFGSLVNSYAMAWVGLWHGLKTRRAGAAGLQTLTRIVLIPSAIFMLPLAVLIVSAGGRGTGLLSGSGVIWATVMTINSVWFCTIARKKLEREFRIRAAGVEPDQSPYVPGVQVAPPGPLAPRPA